jgi:hypothetical protein
MWDKCPAFTKNNNKYWVVRVFARKVCFSVFSLPQGSQPKVVALPTKLKNTSSTKLQNPQKSPNPTIAKTFLKKQTLSNAPPTLQLV